MDSSTLNQRKARTREKVRALLANAPMDLVQEWSAAIARRLWELPQVQSAQWVMSYVSIGKEVQTHDLIRDLLARGKRVAAPLTQRPGLLASEIKDFDADLAPGALGILEPKPELLRPVDPKVLEVVLVPGVAFDLGCRRLGRGKGHYEHFLAQLSDDCFTIGLAFELQVVPRVPTDENDLRVKCLITQDHATYRPVPAV